MKFSLGNKIMGLALLMVAMLLALGAVTFWASTELVTRADSANMRLGDAAQANLASYWAVKQYQVQADLIINRKLDLVEEFAKAAGQFDKYQAAIVKMADTAEEKQRAAQVGKAEQRFVELFQQGVVPEVKYQLEGNLKKWTRQSFELISTVEEGCRELVEAFRQRMKIAILAQELDTATQQAELLDAANQVAFWAVKQHQYQSDLIISQDLKAVD